MFERRKLLFVEDDPCEAENIRGLLKELKADFVFVADKASALSALAKQSFEFMLTDLHLESRPGIERPDAFLLIEFAREHQPNLTIVATSADPRRELVDQVLSIGAHHFVRKPLINADEVQIAFQMARERKLMAAQGQKAKRVPIARGRWEKFAKLYPYGIVMGEREHKLARLAAKKKASCLILGETGTGKEEMAKIIHKMRSESEGALPFVAVNCATITGNLAESLLFGHRKGAFTGAEDSTLGYIGETDGGILFLDEIHTLSIPVQQKLLRVLNDGTYNRLGETKTCRSQFQLLAASTRDLDAEIQAGRFLIDLRMRMMGLDIEIAPLRERKEDIPALVALFLSKKELPLSEGVFQALVRKLQSFQWSGNIRQLFKSLEAWLLTCELDDEPPTAENFPIFRDIELPLGGPAGSSYVPAGRPDFNKALSEDRNYEEMMEIFERELIIRTIDRHSTIAAVSRVLGLPRSTLDAKRRRFGLT